MNDERIPCRTPGCKYTILSATAKANDGYCMPCVQKRLREEEEEYIRRNRREVDPYAGIDDVVEMLRVMHTRRPRDPLIVERPAPKSGEEIYRSLDLDQANRLMDLAAAAMRDEDEDFAEEIAKFLATQTTHALEPMLPAWIEQNHFHPAVIFRNAGPGIRDAIVAALAAGTVRANEALSALAWIGDTSVQTLFREWKSQPPSWQSSLHVSPDRYTHVAGWELSSRQRRNLFHRECWSVTPATNELQPSDSIAVMKETAQTCPWCQRLLIHLLEVNLSDERFAFLGFDGPRLPILTCDACTCFGTGFVFARVSPEGEAQLSPENIIPAWLPKDLSTWERSPWKDQPISIQARDATCGVDWTMPIAISQIGGLPAWVQDQAYPQCPGCSQTMTFIVQIDNGQFPLNEGVYYGFACAPCRMTATTYQQT